MVFDRVKELVNESGNIVFLGGAGVSTGSGIPDFRSASGLYKRDSGTDFSPEYMLSHSFYRDYPEDFTSYYKKNLIKRDARPNRAHRALVELEKRGQLRQIISQNIDGLHQMAGSKNVIEIHGNLRDYYCVKCREAYDLDYVLQTDTLDLCPKCGGIIRPDIVLYEEALDLDKQSRAIEAIAGADVLIVGGTSLVVYPVAGFLRFYRGNKLVLINIEKTPRDGLADYVIHDDIGRVLGDIVGVE